MQNGMMSPQPQQSQYFNGTIIYDGESIEVKDGVAIMDGEKYIVSDDGTLVVNEKGELVGVIQDGNLIEATQEIIDQLRQQGVFG